jgi:hypothetical protein
MNAFTERAGRALEAILDHIGGRQKRRIVDTIDCPNCEGKITFLVCYYNGHITARCATKGCVAFRE